jgi:two-component system NtrC family sensor kinase
MKLVPKLNLAFIAGVSVILAANGYLRVRREVALFESDRVRDDVVIGETLGAAVETVWRSEGPARALTMVRQADAKQGRVHVRWVWLDGSDGTWTSARLGTLRGNAPGGATAPSRGTTTFENRRYTFVPVEVPDGRRGAIEVSEPLSVERSYIRRTILDTVLTMLSLDAVCAALATMLGTWFVGRPIGALMNKARRVGRGDFGEPLHLAQRDELAELAMEMNAMCARLVDAQVRVASETQARITMLEQLRHADRVMTVGKLASGIAHELGTPLNVVEARAGMIAAGDTSSSESAEYARVIVHATEQMTRIIRQVLAFARPGAAKTTALDLVSLGERPLSLLEPLAAKKQVVLELVHDDPPVHAQADGGQIEQVLTNLVMNGIQAMSQPGVVRVFIDRAYARPPGESGAHEDECARIRVQDQGNGISEADRPHVFEPFFTTKDVGEGTGLGLAVTHGIVREHGGWIDVTSAAAPTELTVYLPIAHAE